MASQAPAPAADGPRETFCNRKHGSGQPNKKFIFSVVFGVLLACNAGFVNAVTLNTRFKVVVSHITGHVTSSARIVINNDMTTFGYDMLVIFCFFLGACLCGLMINAPKFHLDHRYGFGLLIEGILLFIATIFLYGDDAMGCGSCQFFGVGLCAMACGLQNAMTTVYSGLLVRTTHFTGVITDIGVLSGAYLRGWRKEDWWRFQMFLPLLCAYWCGGAAGGYITQQYNYLALFFPTAICLSLGAIYYTVMMLYFFGRVTVRMAVRAGHAIQHSRRRHHDGDHKSPGAGSNASPGNGNGATPSPAAAKDNDLSMAQFAGDEQEEDVEQQQPAAVQAHQDEEAEEEHEGGEEAAEEQEEEEEDAENDALHRALTAGAGPASDAYVERPASRSGAPASAQKLPPSAQSQSQSHLSVRPGAAATAGNAVRRPSPLDTRSESGSMSSIVDTVRPVIAGASGAGAGVGPSAAARQPSLDLPGRGQSGPTSPAIPENNLHALAAEATRTAGGNVVRAAQRIDNTVIRAQQPALPGAAGKSWLPRSADKRAPEPMIR